MKKIYVIIVTYNGMKWIEKCLKNLSASIVPLHPIIVDNYSSDSTVEFVKSNFPNVHLIETGENLGFGRANNVGIKYALDHNADGVFLLNQDAYIYPETVELLLPFMDEYGIVSPVHLDGTGTCFDRGFVNTLRMSSIMLPTLIEDLMLKKQDSTCIYDISFINAAAWLLSKRTLNKIGGFDPIFFHYGEDENYCQRVLYHGMKIGFVSSSFVCHDRDQKTLSTVYLQKYKERAFLIECMNVLSDTNLISFRFQLKQLFIALILFCLFKVEDAKFRFNLVKFIMKNKHEIRSHRNKDCKISANWL